MTPAIFFSRLILYMMYAIIVNVVAVLFYLLSSAVPTLAQTPPKGLESCFAYYNYGKVKVHLSSEKPSYNSSEKVHIKGSIVNENTFPLIDVILYAQVRRINRQSALENGHYIVDRVTLLEHINLMAGETKGLDMSVPVKSSYPQGDYEIQYYIFSKEGFHYAGRAFLEEDNAGTTRFSIVSGPKPDFYFDIDNLKVDGQVRNIRGVTDEFRRGTVMFDIAMVDTRTNKTPLNALVKFYVFEDDLEDRMLSQKRVTIESTDQPFHLEFTPPEQGAYIMLMQVDSPVQSVIKYRFASTSDQAADLRMNDVGVSDFPATRNSRAWVCFHSPMAQFAPLTEVKLSVLSANQKVIEQVSLTESFSPEVQAISVPLSKLADGSDFFVEAQFKNPSDISRTKSVRIHYNCDTFSDSLRDFTVAQGTADPFTLLIKGTNICNKEVKEGKINNIKITQNGKIIKEETNINKLPYTFSLQDLDKGTYLAQVKIGDKSKETNITLLTSGSPQTSAVNKPSTRYLVLIVFGLLIAAAITFSIAQKKKSS